MNFKSILFAVLLLVIGFVAGQSFFKASGQGNVAAKESAFDRVMREQTIRCGYTPAPPFVIKDPTTGKLSGIAYEVVESLGKALKLKIDWAEEVGWGSFPTALENGRIDAFCVGAWSSSARARVTDVTVPMSFQPYYAYVRAEDDRFDNKLESLNSDSFTVSTIDGDTSSIIARSDFPKAKTVSLPENASTDEILVNVVTGKADATFFHPSLVAKFNANNPKKVKPVPSAAPIRVFENVIFIAQKQDAFRQMLNASLKELHSSGQIDKIIATYEKEPGSILRVAPGYSK